MTCFAGCQEDGCGYFGFYGASPSPSPARGDAPRPPPLLLWRHQLARLRHKAVRRKPMPRTTRTRLIRGLSYALAMVLAPLLVGVAGLALRVASDIRSDTNPPPFTGALPAPPPHDAG